MSDNLELWSKYFNPPSDALKGFKRAGGFSGTAVEPMWMKRCATEEWGPMGDKWGLEVVHEEFIPVAENWILHVSNCRIFYPRTGTKAEGMPAYIPCVGQTWAASVGSKGPVYDDECVKKSRTDALTSGLKDLGFGAAIWMGAFDGSKWASLPEAHKPQPEKNEPKGSEPDPSEVLEKFTGLYKTGMQKLGGEMFLSRANLIIENKYGGLGAKDLPLEKQRELFQDLKKMIENGGKENV
jgi:hypothetical protein